jgi:hypothetical protein
MKTFFRAKFALFPLAVFITLIGYVSPALAISVGLAVALIVCAWRVYSGQIKNFELAVLVVFAALSTGVSLAPDRVGPLAIPLAFIGFSIYAFGTVVLRRPWTIEFSRAAYPHDTEKPLFIRINMLALRDVGCAFPPARGRARAKCGHNGHVWHCDRGSARLNLRTETTWRARRAALWVTISDAEPRA